MSGAFQPSSVLPSKIRRNPSSSVGEEAQPVVSNVEPEARSRVSRANVLMRGIRLNKPPRSQEYRGNISPVSKPALFGKYQILREVGRGGMGIVYEAMDAALNRRIALKTMIVSPN